VKEDGRPTISRVSAGSYRRLGSDELARRALLAAGVSSPCRLCPRLCGAMRKQDQPGRCRTGLQALVASWGPHFGEERVLVGGTGSGTVFFGGCNLDCVYCQNYELSQVGEGTSVTAEFLASVFMSLQRQGCCNLNLVSPSHVVPVILEALGLAVDSGLALPLVYNTGGYDSAETLELLDGVVDIYMPDMKYADPAVGLRLSGVPDYPQRNQEAVRMMHAQVGDLVIQGGVAISGLLIRHLVLPGGLAGTAQIAAFVAEQISPRSAFHLMRQYYPCYHAAQHPPLDRRVTAAEWQTARQAVLDAGLELWAEP